MTLITLFRVVILSALSLAIPARILAADELVLPDTQTPECVSIVTRYNAALEEAGNKHTSAMTQHISRYLDEAGALLKEKRKTRNTTGVAIASTTISIFESALSNLTATGTFELPAKIRREIEPTVAEFTTGRTIIDTTFTTAKTKLFTQFSDEFAAQILKIKPALTGPDARAKIDERFQAMVKEALSPASKGGLSGKNAGSPTPADAGTNADIAASATPVMAESGTSPTWITVGTLTANIRAMEVLEIPLAGMGMGSNVLSQYSVMSASTLEILFLATVTNFTSPAALYRLTRIPKFNDVSIMDWPSAANGYRLNLRTPSPERIPFPIGFELQVSALPQPVLSKAALLAKRNLTLSIRSVPPHAAVYIDGTLKPDTLTPCTFQIPPGLHDFRLSLTGFQDLIVTNYTFTVGREINWTFKPVAKPKASN